MPSAVRHVVEDGQPYPVVRLSGVLDASTGPAVRTALLDVLAQQPEAVIVDVSDLTPADSAASDVLRELDRDTADWPGAHLVLCAPGADWVWKSAGLPIWPSRASAVAELGDPDPGQYLNLSLEPAVGAARRSRELVTEACGRWDLPGLAGPSCIVVTEMVNNVVAHARTPMIVLLARRGELMTVAVRDGSATLPRFAGPVAPTAYGGRGLLLIDSVADRWGSLPLAGGKVVWAIMHGHDKATDIASEQIKGSGIRDPGRG
jgi:anti-anti-sigma regulatory factor